MGLLKRGLQQIRHLIERAGYSLHPKADYFVADQLALLSGKHSVTIFDVGANEGKITRVYHNLFPDARIYCLEPIPHIAAQLRAGFDGIQVIESALADDDGTAHFYLKEFEDTSSLLQTDLAQMPESYRTVMQSKGSITVSTTRLDTLMDKLDIEHIDILKMDIQGGEYKALEGAYEALLNGKISVVAIEVFFEKYYSDHKLFSDILYILYKHHYRLHRLYNFNFSGTTGRPQWADAIFLAPGFSPSNGCKA